jgi:PilZ domain
MHIANSNNEAKLDIIVEGTAERRRASRVQTVFRVARVITGADEGLARLQNISDQGVSLQLHLPVLLGDPLVVELAEGVTVTGRVVWTSGSDCGVQLDKEVDSAALLGDLAHHARSPAGRPLRLPVAAAALTRGDNGTRVIEVTDVSQRGMKFIHDGSFTEGLQVKITFCSGMERRGVVRWTDGNIAGLMLLDPFSTEELGRASNLQSP